MLCYAKIPPTASSDEKIKNFLPFQPDTNLIFIDTSTSPKNINGIYQALKTQLLTSHSKLMIDTINSLGKNAREISKELLWFKENEVPLTILDIPSTHDTLSNPINVISDLYSSLAKIEINNVKSKQKEGINKALISQKPYGRKKTPYPKNWEETYLLWKNKQITVAEFMALTGLKKGTLYNLIKEYKNVEASETSA